MQGKGFFSSVTAPGPSSKHSPGRAHPAPEKARSFSFPRKGVRSALILTVSLLALPVFAGTLGADRLTGTSGSEALEGLAGDDVLIGDPPVQGDVIILSRDDNGNQQAGDSDKPVFSPDGSSVVFESDAQLTTKTVPVDILGGPELARQIYRRTLATNTTTLISLGFDAKAANGACYNPTIAPNGLTAFTSHATNLVSGDSGTLNTEIFMTKFSGASLQRVTALSDGTESTFASSPPSFGGLNPSKPIFSTNDPALSGGAGFHIVMKDTTTQNGVGALATLSRDAAGVLLAGDNSSPRYTADGQGMVFVNHNAGNYRVLLKDIVAPGGTGALRLVSADEDGVEAAGFNGSPTVRSDGQAVAFRTNAASLGGGAVQQIVEKDISGPDATGAVRILSSDAAGTKGLSDSGSPVYSNDGTKLAFVTRASNLVGTTSTSNGKAQIAVKDLVTGNVAIVSVNKNGELGNGDSDNPAFSPDGTMLAFSSQATNLALDANGNFIDTNGATRDIFLVSLSALGGNDTLSGGDGNDLLDAGEGDDEFSGGAGDDRLFGGYGLDTVVYPGPRQRFAIASGAVLGAWTVTDLAAGSPEGTDVLAGIDSIKFGNDPAVPISFDGNNTAPITQGIEPVDPMTPLPIVLQPGVAGPAFKMLAFDMDAGDDAALTLSIAVPAVAGTVEILDPAALTFRYVRGADAAAVNDSFTLKVSDPWGGEALFLTALALPGNVTGSDNGETLDGDSLDDMLSGGGGDDILFGYEGNDILDGGPGADTMSGGAGDDFYSVDNEDDQVIENANEGLDEMQASVSYTLPANVENLILTGMGNITGIGNSLDNFIQGNSASNILKGEDGSDTLFDYEGNDILDGGPGADTMVGGAGDDTYYIDALGDIVTEKVGEGMDTAIITVANYDKTKLAHVEVITDMTAGDGNVIPGGPGNDALTGTSGNDTIDGGAGADTMSGGGGNDTYLVDNAGDKVIETGGQGVDSVQASVSYTLPTNVENLTLTGTGNINGTGNALANVLTGNAGRNVLKGGLGKDSLTGGAGADIFVFTSPKDSPAKKTLRDVILDFTSADKIDLRGMDANAKKKGKQRFSFIGAKVAGKRLILR